MRIRTATTAAAALALTLVGCSSSDDSAEPAADVPEYKITQQDDSGNQRNVEVEVTSTTSLRAVFDDVTKRLTDEAGYTIVINCSTGGTKSADNRLANGRYAVGQMGAAATGLDAGTADFSTNKGRTCPDSSS